MQENKISQFKIGDVVIKKSKKPFQHGKKTAVIVGFGKMIIPTTQYKKTEVKIVPCVWLENCSNGPVRSSMVIRTS